MVETAAAWIASHRDRYNKYTRERAKEKRALIVRQCKSCNCSISKGYSLCSKCRKQRASDCAGAWKKRNPDKVKEQARKATANSKAKRQADPVLAKANRERLERWKAEHPDRVKQAEIVAGRKHAHKRRHDQVISFALADWERALAHFSGCAYCGAVGELQQDHFVPFSRGGSLTSDNVVPACAHCNRSKWHADPLEWCFSTGRMVQYALAADYLGALN